MKKIFSSITLAFIVISATSCAKEVVRPYDNNYTLSSSSINGVHIGTVDISSNTADLYNNSNQYMGTVQMFKKGEQCVGSALQIKSPIIPKNLSSDYNGAWKKSGMYYMLKANGWAFRSGNNEYSGDMIIVTIPSGGGTIKPESAKVSWTNRIFDEETYMTDYMSEYMDMDPVPGLFPKEQTVSQNMDGYGNITHSM